jgi:FkbH-like protein
VGRIPFSEPFSRVVARRWSGLILAILGKTARAVVVDLDNTLWGGVLGEDGIAGVQLGGDFPGNAYMAFQRVLKSVTGRGIALAVCSKNDEDLALQAIDRLPAMQIRSGDIVAHRINWRPKWENIREIAAELNLGLESLLFIDDNPAERAAARRNLPGLRVLELPEDPAFYAEALSASPWLEVAAITAEDRKRVQSYRARREMEQQRTQAASLEDFYESLQMKLYLQPLSDGNAARAAQLCMKTNQFNTTTRRYDQRELRKIVDDGDDVVVVGLQDRYSELENIGLIILRAEGANGREGMVDSYLLSCRILGRGIETAVLHWALQRAAARNWSSVRGMIIETERNTPVRSIFRDAGFESGVRPGEWVARTDTPPRLPPWLTVVDGMAAAVES